MTTVQDAFIAVVKAAVLPGVGVFDSIVQGTAPAQYVAVYPANGERTKGDALCGYRNGLFRFQITSVVSSSANLGMECRGLASRCRDALVGVRLSVDGWKCGPVEHDFSNPPVRDESVIDKPTVYAADGYVLLADRLT